VVRGHARAIRWPYVVRGGPPSRMRGGTLALTASAMLVLMAASGCGGNDKASPAQTTPHATTSSANGSTPTPSTGNAVTGTEEATSPSDTTPTNGPRGGAGAPTPQRYSLAATRRCLDRAGLRVGPVEKTDSRLRALGDLAQRTSISVHADGKVIGVAFGDAELLAELLAVPNDPYMIETRGNVVLLYLPSAKPQALRVRDCLRP
jgi:hypothetical protein